MKMNKPIRKRQIKRKKIGICKFLYEKLEDDSFKLAKWTNKKEGEFCLHWLHASSGSWKVKTDSELFRLWALHKGKLNEERGHDKPNYKTWKANFRCAMKSRYELEEIKINNSKYRKKDVKFWKFTDLSFINDQSHKTQNQNSDDKESNNCRSQIQEVTKNSRKTEKPKRKTKLKIDYNEINDIEDEHIMSKETIYNIDSGVQMQDFSLLSAKDTFTLPLNEEIENSHFMDILEQDKNAQEELAQFGNSSYSFMHPVAIDELELNSSSEIEILQSLNQIVPNQLRCDRGISYEYDDDSNQIGNYYSDRMLKGLSMSMY